MGVAVAQTTIPSSSWSLWPVVVSHDDSPQVAQGWWAMPLVPPWLILLLARRRLIVNWLSGSKLLFLLVLLPLAAAAAEAVLPGLLLLCAAKLFLLGFKNVNLRLLPAMVFRWWCSVSYQVFIIVIVCRYNYLHLQLCVCALRSWTFFGIILSEEVFVYYSTVFPLSLDDVSTVKIINLLV